MHCIRSTIIIYEYQEGRFPSRKKGHSSIKTLPPVTGTEIVLPSRTNPIVLRENDQRVIICHPLAYLRPIIPIDR
jgi:hypothetical protein